MKKIPTIFNRNPENRSEVLNEPHPSCDWVFNGEGVATRKYDGTCCLINEGKLYKRREINPGKKIPVNFIQADHDNVTGKLVGWVAVDKDKPEDKWHVKAHKASLTDGTYELLGPKIQGNPEGFEDHELLKHSDSEQYANVPRTYDGIKQFLKDKDIEGLVFHHPDGRMAKIKKRDFGLDRAEES